MVANEPCDHRAPPGSRIGRPVDGGGYALTGVMVPRVVFHCTGQKPLPIPIFIGILISYALETMA
jgi:hypothetical protein